VSEVVRDEASIVKTWRCQLTVAGARRGGIRFFVCRQVVSRIERSIESFEAQKSQAGISRSGRGGGVGSSRVESMGRVAGCGR
jgi:hypothetical protein